MITTAVHQIMAWFGKAVPEGDGSNGVALVAVRGGARDRRRVAKAFQTSARAKYLVATDDHVWMRAALIAARELESGRPVVIEVGRTIPKSLQQFLKDLRHFGAVEAILPASRRSTTIRCSPKAYIVVLGPEGVHETICPRTVEVIDRAVLM